MSKATFKAPPVDQEGGAAFGTGGRSLPGPEFFKKRAGDKTGDRLMEFLHNAPHVPPEPEDMR